MKKVTLADQLALSKEIVANLSEEQLQEIEGGAGADGSCSGGGNSCIVVQTHVEQDATEDQA